LHKDALGRLKIARQPNAVLLAAAPERGLVDAEKIRYILEFL
jgi:hypothetical protein